MFSRNKKAQAHTQIFIYILSIIIVAVILLFGYRAIDHFGKKADQVSYIKFKTDFESIVRIIGPDYGSIKRQEFIIGKRYRQICFVDSDYVESKTISSSMHPIIQEMVLGGVGKNTFLMTDSVEDSFDVGEIEASSGFICINSTKGRVRIEFEGLGDRTEIREWLFE